MIINSTEKNGEIAHRIPNFGAFDAKTKKINSWLAGIQKYPHPKIDKTCCFHN